MPQHRGGLNCCPVRALPQAHRLSIMVTTMMFPIISVLVQERPAAPGVLACDHRGTAIRTDYECGRRLIGYRSREKWSAMPPEAIVYNASIRVGEAVVWYVQQAPIPTTSAASCRLRACDSEMPQQGRSHEGMNLKRQKSAVYRRMPPSVQG